MIYNALRLCANAFKLLDDVTFKTRRHCHFNICNLDLDVY